MWELLTAKCEELFVQKRHLASHVVKMFARPLRKTLLVGKATMTIIITQASYFKPPLVREAKLSYI